MGKKWDWLPAAMPAVATLIAQRRAKHGAAWVAECWKHGVIEGQPGWLFAAEGSLTVGTPISAEPILMWHQQRKTAPTAALLDMREPEAGDVA